MRSRWQATWTCFCGMCGDVWRLMIRDPSLGEDKTSEDELDTAVVELSTKLKEWGTVVHGQVEYLLCYACAGSQFQMKQYVVDLEPVGQPVHSKYSDHKPCHVHQLKDSIRCILRALVVLHQAGFAHTDLRWENIILQRAGIWVLIDLEFACVLDTLPFTPNRHVRK
ncbi:hypothetical protein WJX77_001386, partial [Trebouxia sp. C0004]